jgi:hypothetical protein
MSVRAKGWARIVAGFLFAPAIGLYTLDIGFSIVRRDLPVPAFLFFGSFIAYPMAFLFGIPVFAVFRALNWLRWWQVTLGGSSVGLVFLAYVSLGAASFSASEVLAPGALFGGAGAATGLAFWFIAVRSNAMLVPQASPTP